MGKRNERLRPEFIQSASLLLPSPADHQSRFKRPRVGDDATDEVALSLLFMRSHRDTEGEKALATCSEDYTHVTDDEDDAAPSSGIAVCRSACNGSSYGGMPLSRPPRLFHSRPQPALTAIPLPEGRPLPPAPILPRLKSWSAVTASHAKTRLPATNLPPRELQICPPGPSLSTIFGSPTAFEDARLKQTTPGT